jgi:transcriptional regulator with XRE-family HTH domain
MILGDKIAKLRKENSWSQEELAEKMNVSRQAVSKWEGAQTVPDLEKILQLAELFGVTTDYLLKDEIEKEEYTPGHDSPVKTISLQEANEYLAQRKRASLRIAIATFLCIISPVTLIALSGLAEFTDFPISENIAAAFGMVMLLVLVAAAVGIYVYCGFQNDAFGFLDSQPFETEYGITGMVNEKKRAFRNRYVLFNIIGTCICILSVIPFLTAALLEQELLCILLLCGMFLLVGIGVGFFIVAGVRWASFQKLLKDPEYVWQDPAVEGRAQMVKKSIAGIYWMLMVVIYLAWSFLANAWSSSWIIWPIAGVLYAVVAAICNLVIRDDKKSEK